MGQSVVPGPTTARATALLKTNDFVFVGGGITATVVALLAIVIGIVGVEHRGGATIGRDLAGIRVLTGKRLHGADHAGVGRTDGQRARQPTRTHVALVRGDAREVGQDQVGQRHATDGTARIDGHTVVRVGIVR